MRTLLFHRSLWPFARPTSVMLSSKVSSLLFFGVMPSMLSGLGICSIVPTWPEPLSAPFTYISAGPVPRMLPVISLLHFQVEPTNEDESHYQKECFNLSGFGSWRRIEYYVAHIWCGTELDVKSQKTSSVPSWNTPPASFGTGLLNLAIVLDNDTSAAPTIITFDYASVFPLKRFSILLVRDVARSTASAGG